MAEAEVFDVAALLAAHNPWWHAASPPASQAPPGELPALLALLLGSPAPSVLVIEGDRQTGKTTLLHALAHALLATGVAPRQLCLATLDLGPLRWCSAQRIDEAWSSQRSSVPEGAREFLLIDDIHLWSDSEQDGLAQLALAPGRSVVVAGLGGAQLCTRWRSARLRVARQRLAGGSFASYLALRSLNPGVPTAPHSLRELFDWPRSAFPALHAALLILGAHFHDYLAQGGYPAAQRAADAASAQAYLREQLLPRVLRWDAPGRHGVRRGDDLELALTYLAARAGTLLDVPELCEHLTVERPTVRHFLDLLEDVGLLRRIAPLGYGERVQRARFLICLADPALAPALLWRDATAADPPGLHAQVESALYRHLQGAYGRRGARVSYAPQGRHQHSLVVESGRQILPFGLHYLDTRSAPRALSGLSSFCLQQGIQRGYVATRLAEDFGPLLWSERGPLALMRIPAALLCLWLAAAEPAGLEPG